MKLTKVAITGARGMLGSHMKVVLSENDIDCKVIDRNSWDLCDWKTGEELDEIFNGIDAFIHIGAAVPSVTNPKNIQTLFDSNIRSVTNLCEHALEKDIPIVYISGATVYKGVHSVDIKEDALKTTNNFGGFYGFTKYLAEQVVSHFAHNGLRQVSLRPSSIYGYGMGDDVLVANFLARAKKNSEITIKAPSSNSVNLIHAYDVANAVILALRNEAWGVYNIAAKSNTSIYDLAKYCTEIYDAGKIIIDVEDEKLKDQAFLRFDLNYEKAQKFFDYKPLVSIKKGLEIMAKKKFSPEEI
ncbi:MAG: hypothetical protein BM556_08945 [Bacteriovorax sp. MedPE-SWde]|nr:MAG: hypothetical protein BM556_08945 [Bacteriovorax sp. MedPE-SWde]